MVCDFVKTNQLIHLRGLYIILYKNLAPPPKEVYKYCVLVCVYVRERGGGGEERRKRWGGEEGGRERLFKVILET